MYGCKDEVCVGACVCACMYVHVCVWVNMYGCEDGVHVCGEVHACVCVHA